MKTAYKYILILLLSILNGYVYAKNFDMQFNKFPIGDEGNLRVMSILKDKKGFLWIGTGNSLYKYDGYKFKEYAHTPLDSNSLSYGNIFSIHEDTDGFLWIGTQSGLNKMCPWKSGEGFEHFWPFPKKKYSNKNWIKKIFEDKAGKIWISAYGYELYTFDRDSENFTEVVLEPGFIDKSESFGTEMPFKSIISINEDKDGVLWVCTQGGLYKYDRLNNVFLLFKPNPMEPDHYSNKIHSISEDNSNNFWVATAFGLYKFNKKKNTFNLQLLPEPEFWQESFKNAIYATQEDSQGSLWLRAETGIYRYNTTTNEYKFWKYPALLAEEYRKDYWNLRDFLSLSLFFVESPEIVWFAMPSKGLYRLTVKNSNFKIYQNDPGNKNSLSSNNITDIFEDNKGALWIGTGNGLNRFERETQKIDVYKHNPEDPKSIAGNHVKEIYQDKAGMLWFGTWGKGLSKLVHSETDSVEFLNFRHDSTNPGSLPDNHIAYFQSDDKGNMMVATLGVGRGLCKMENDSFILFEDKHTYINNDTCLQEKVPGEIWWHHWVGLYRELPPITKISNYKYQAHKSIIYKHDPDDPHSLNTDRIHVKFESNIYQPGTMWLGTWGGGLNKMIKEPVEGTDQYRMHFKHYTEEDGLANNFIASIEEDDEGNLWIGTADGLSKFNPRTEVFKNYYVADGLPLNIFNIGIASCKSKDGMLYFGTENGMVAFYPDSIYENTSIPPVVITDIRLFNKPLRAGENSFIEFTAPYTDKIELPYNQNFLSFEFAALDYTNPEKNVYKYMMEGLDMKWIDAGHRRFVDYPGLKPGDYIFRVNGTNNDGVWNPEGASLKIIILPPWWKTIYAYTGYGIFFLLLITGYVRWRTRQLEKEKIKLEKQVKERTRKIEEHEKKIEAQKELVERRNKQIEERNQQIVELDQVKTRFFTNVSHEFRTPLTLIQGPVEEMIADPKLTTRERQKKLNMIHRNSRRLLGLVNQLLDISKVDSGKMKLELVKGDIFESLRMITGSFSSLAETKGIVYKCRIPHIQKQTWFDAEILEKIVVNLLSNAFKFSPEAGEVIFDVRLAEGEEAVPAEILEFSVTDQGPGIPTGSLEKIFDRFYQEESFGGKVGAGTGIGLSLTRDLVNLNHGEIMVESEPGRGSTFTVKLPLGKDHLNESEYVISDREKDTVFIEPEIVTESLEATVPEQEEEQPDKHAEKPIILIVEDNSDIRIHICDNFEDEYRVMEAIDGSAGLKKAIDALPDLIITDLMMPKMDGIEMCKRIKSDERTSHIPVVMLTAKVTLEDKLEGFDTGVDDFIAKPFQMKELKARVHNLIEQRRKLRERFSRELTLEPHEITVNSYDEEFLNRAIVTVESHMSDENFGINNFQKELNMSPTTLFRKLHSLTNQSPSGFIRSIRIKRAAQLIKQNYGNIANIAYEVGFNNPSYFSKCFKEIIGISPAEYSKN